MSSSSWMAIQWLLKDIWLPKVLNQFVLTNITKSIRSEKPNLFNLSEGSIIWVETYCLDIPNTVPTPRIILSIWTVSPTFALKLSCAYLETAVACMVCFAYAHQPHYQKFLVSCLRRIDCTHSAALLELKI